MRKSTISNELGPVSACLHVARNLLLAQAEKAHGPRRRRLKHIEGAVLDAIVAVARRGLTPDEYRAMTERGRAELAAASRP